MTVKPSAITETQGLGDLVAARISEIQQLADAGDWEKIEAVVRNLPALLKQIPETDRHAALVATRDCIDSLRERAAEKSEEIGTKLAALHTGRRASESYRANEVVEIST